MSVLAFDYENRRGYAINALLDSFSERIRFDPDVVDAETVLGYLTAALEARVKSHSYPAGTKLGARQLDFDVMHDCGRLTTPPGYKKEDVGRWAFPIVHDAQGTLCVVFVRHIEPIVLDNDHPHVLRVSAMDKDPDEISLPLKWVCQDANDVMVVTDIEKKAKALFLF